MGSFSFQKNSVIRTEKNGEEEEKNAGEQALEEGMNTAEDAASEMSGKARHQRIKRKYASEKGKKQTRKVFLRKQMLERRREISVSESGIRFLDLVTKYCQDHSGRLLLLLMAAFLFTGLFTMASSCSACVQGTEVILQDESVQNYLYTYDTSADVGTYLDYDIPEEALSDPVFANMITEAEKYLGTSYVWGGESPDTGFDCSGYVSWVINHCGNGWYVGRLTAEGLRSICTIVSPSEAKPGDLIFFQGTYDTEGASHVGIYVGNNMMIHCGDPISYASIEAEYWQEHFYCFGRIS